jgi:predicted HTH domain antitoxin
MKIFSDQDLSERTEELIRCAEVGKLSVVTALGKPVFIAVPFDEMLLQSGVRTSLAIKLFDEAVLTLAQAAKLAGLGIEEMIERTGAAGVTVVRHIAGGLDEELDAIARQGRRQ